MDDDSLNDDLDPSVFGPGTAISTGEDSPTVQARPTHHKYDERALSTYIYPTNLPVRDYQYNIVCRSIFHNVLVALPTGLGKTFIASTVMLNFSRWFPNSKIVFMAPTKPLVAQQIKACCGITGLSSKKVAILLDKTRRNRSDIWEAKQVFFTTPQVVENDLTAGTLDPRSVVLLVIDEAHRAKGNYAYNNVVRFLTRFNSSVRILAMTATPASTVEGVQEIIDNLSISRVEVRTERSIDTFKYLKRKTVERFTVAVSDDVRLAIDAVSEAVAPILKIANEKKIYDVTDPSRINAFTSLDAQRRVLANRNIPEGVKWANHAILSILIVAGQCLRRLNIYGIRSFFSYFNAKQRDFTEKYESKKSKNHMAAKFYCNPGLTKFMQRCEAWVREPAFLGHQKLEIVIKELDKFFNTTTNIDSRVIIFTEFRESALDIVRAIEQQNSNLKPHIFIGQAKEKDKTEDEKLNKTSSAKRPRGKQNTIRSLNSHTSSELAQSTGMNQKMQKEIISKFKRGSYNILVATSIGEEGLDIGEVDLIICYDSTSSPIKNVQRMGRTGRNRDGKVILLFSSNEESKFDKAMGGYEYIQQLIMNGKQVNLHAQNRILPAEFSPTAEKVFIEVPEENAALKEEDDDDEIIKIATAYMAGTKSATKKSKISAKEKKKEKIPKRFFMPDNVEHGFQSASAIMRQSEDNSGNEKRRRLDNVNTSDILDSILDSEEDEEFLLQTRPTITADDISGFSMTNTSKMNTRKRPSDTTSPETDSPVSTPFQESAAKAEPHKVLAQAEITGVFSNSYAEGETKKSSSTSLSHQEPREIQASTKQSDEVFKDSEIKQENTSENLDSDEFSDDDEIMALVRRTQSGEWSGSPANGNHIQETGQTSESSHQKGSENKVEDPEFVISDDAEILTKDQRTELFMNYFTPVEAHRLIDCYIPRPTTRLPQEALHGSRTKKFVSMVSNMISKNKPKSQIKCDKQYS